MFGHVMMEVELTGIFHKMIVTITVVWNVLIMVMKVKIHAMHVIKDVVVIRIAIIIATIIIVKVELLAV